LLIYLILQLLPKVVFVVDILGLTSAPLDGNRTGHWNFDRFRSVPVPLDGNCFFSALADQLYASGIDDMHRSAMHVRSELITFLRSDSTLCSQVKENLELNDTLDKYFDGISENGT
jgi:hypothetical protein